MGTEQSREEKKPHNLVLQLKRLPSAPALVQEIIQLTEDMNASVRDLADSVRKDAACAARVLRMANSAYYAFSRRVDSIEKAAILIGFNNVKFIALSLITYDFFRRDGEGKKFFNKLWIHNLYVADVCRWLSARLNMVQQEDLLYSAGIFHDIGKLLFIANFPVEYTQIAHESEAEKVSLCEKEKQVFGVDHSQIGSWLLKKWLFPENLQAVVANHHNSAGVTEFITAEVALANYIVSDYGVGLGWQVPPSSFAGWPHKHLLIDPDFKAALKEHMSEIQKRTEVFQEFIG